MKIKHIVSILVICFASVFAYAAGQLFTVKSASMYKDIPNSVVLPASYAKDAAKKYPVIYLLHGFGGDYQTWPNQTKKSLQQLADALDIIFVCPDGARSWYWDSPADPKSKYETYVSKELVEAVDKEFRTIKDRSARAITGFSMGGHGGLWLGIRHPDVFGSCGSMSGGVDIRPFPNNWEMAKSLGEYSQNPQVWDEHTVINQLYRIKPNSINIIIDCGYGDFFYAVNQALHEKMEYLKINHDYIVRPGVHNHEYWDNAVDYQIMFFRNCFYKDGAYSKN